MRNVDSGDGSLAGTNRAFVVVLDLSGLRPDDVAAWRDRGEHAEVWIVRARNSQSAIIKAEREVKNSGCSGVHVNTCEER